MVYDHNVHLAQVHTRRASEAEEIQNDFLSFAAVTGVDYNVEDSTISVTIDPGQLETAESTEKWFATRAFAYLSGWTLVVNGATQPPPRAS